MGNSQSQPSKSTLLGRLLWNIKAMGFQGQIRQKGLIYYSDTVWPQCRLYNRPQWPENRTLDYNTLQDLDNFCHHQGKRLETPHAQAFFALRSQPSLCESWSTSQILLALLWATSSLYKVSWCLFRHFFFFLEPFWPQPTPYGFQTLFSRYRSSSTTSTLCSILPPSPAPLPVLEARSETSAPTCTLRVSRLYPTSISPLPIPHPEKL